MSLKINSAYFAGKKVLVAPLDWGLGHATRCIPIIKEIIGAGATVWLAGERQQKILLQKEFPQLPFLELQGYRIRYSTRGFVWKMMLQIPKILFAMRSENSWLKNKIIKYGFDLIISDNRYGLSNKNAKCIFITHQLSIKTGLGKWSELVLQHINYKLINRFNECWIPDEEGESNLAGELSHPKFFPTTLLKYIGTQSRLEKLIGQETENHLLIILSGPEPQRTIFEKIIMKELSVYKGTATVVRGLPFAEREIISTETVQFYNHLSAKLFNEEIVKASFIISRSGYSTIMDIQKLNKKSILIPTPEQSEQEYLASYLFKKQLAYCVLQNEFSLKTSLEEAKKFDYKFLQQRN
ncbi:MAG: glycosyl transferase family 28 [Chitinophagaceae bacterium]|nr:MAG: glycosyl transferase family 28 [Chitinophagaceae bacterium]